MIQNSIENHLLFTLSRILGAVEKHKSILRTSSAMTIDVVDVAGTIGLVAEGVTVGVFVFTGGGVVVGGSVGVTVLVAV